MDARRSLLKGLFDDAGLFPPASLPMREAAAAHERSRRGPYAWMLSTFVCPAARVGEMPDGFSVPLSVIVREPADVVSLAGDVRQVETPLPADDAAALRVDVPLFVEIPAGDATAVERLATHPPAGAKIRCGGDTIPPPEAVAETIAACRDLGVRMKATAGLHHPFAVAGKQHGFLNLLAAVMLAHVETAEPPLLTQALSDEDQAAFTLDSQAFRWHDHEWDEAACAAARASLFASIGSCSFDEPVDDLTAIGVLPL